MMIEIKNLTVSVEGKIITGMREMMNNEYFNIIR